MDDPPRYPIAQAVRAAYQAGEEDEALEPIVRVDEAGRPVGRIGDGDYLIFYDIRGEREADLVVVNFCNVDVLGHIENQLAILEAVAEVDRCIGDVVAAALVHGVTAVVTADHGTVERWLYPDGAVDTGHTDSLVPLILVDPLLRGQPLRPGGTLCDVAPTVLHLLGLPQPAEMSGNSLLPAAVPRQRRRVLLVIADGWGSRGDPYGNLILEAQTPVMDRLQQEWPCTRVSAAGEVVGMPPGTVGNSEVGHLPIGAGSRSGGSLPSRGAQPDCPRPPGACFRKQGMV